MTRIQDILENVPTERIEDCMKELTVAIIQMKLSYDLAVDLDPSAKAVLPDPLIWNDDGKGEIQVTHSFNDQEIMKTKETL